MPRSKKGQQKVQILQKTTVRFVITLHLLLGNSWRCSWAGPGTWSRSETSSILQILISENILFNRAGHMRDNCCLTTWHRFNRAGHKRDNCCLTTWHRFNRAGHKRDNCCLTTWHRFNRAGHMRNNCCNNPDTVLRPNIACHITG